MSRDVKQYDSHFLKWKARGTSGNGARLRPDDHELPVRPRGFDAPKSGAVVVLGHPAYYPRFGFSPSARFGIGCEHDVPEDVFMIVELQAGFLRGAFGTIKYHAAFSSA